MAYENQQQSILTATDWQHIRQIIREELQANNNEIQSKVEYLTNLLPFATYMGNDTVLTKSYFNVQYLVSAHDSIVAPYLIRYGVYESELTKYLLANLKPDSVFVDVGANIGYYSCMAAKRINQAPGKVFSFEANIHAYELLQRNMMLNWVDCPIALEHVAVTEKRGQITFKNLRHKFVNSQIAAEPNAGHSTPEVEYVTVNTISLDEYFKGGQAIDFLKIDVEGAEMRVLSGATAVIEASPNLRILIEWSVPQLQQLGANPAEFLEFFSSRGFKPHTLDWRDGQKCAVDYNYIQQKEYICSILFER